MKQALVLCSGGIDSVVLSYHLKKRNYSITLLFFDYGQNGRERELECLRYHARLLKSNLKIIKLDTIKSSLIHSKKPFEPVTKNMLKDTKKISRQWYVPCRNLIFLSQALSIAEGSNANKKDPIEIFVGFGSEGEDCYPDASKRFIKLFNETATFLCSQKCNVLAPFIDKDKEDIISRGVELDVALEKTWSCYSNKKYHCGSCLACALRKQGFYWANVSDPTTYLS